MILVWTAVILSLATFPTQATKALETAIEAKDAAGIQRLLKADPGLAKGHNANGIAMLSLAAQTDCVACVRALLDAGADAKAKDKDPLTRTPLHWAAGWSTIEVVRLLVDRGAPRNSRTSKGDTPLVLAQNNFYKDSTNERRQIVAFLSKPPK